MARTMTAAATSHFRTLLAHAGFRGLPLFAAVSGRCGCPQRHSLRCHGAHDVRRLVAGRCHGTLPQATGWRVGPAWACTLTIFQSAKTVDLTKRVNELAHQVL